MRTRNLSLLTLLVFLLTSCMPDSFTKFKEDPPAKKVSSGGSTGSSGEATPTPTPTATPTPSDVVYTVESVGFYQSKGDSYVFGLANGDGFNVGDTVNFSQALFFSNTETYNFVGTITNINIFEDETVIAVKLDGSPEVGGAPIDFDYDGNFSGYDTNYASDAATSYTFIASGYYIDNCSTGYGTCALGSVATSYVTGNPVLLVDPGVPITSPFPNAVLKSLSKRIHIVGTGTDDARDLTWDYEISPSILGLGVKDLSDGVSTSDAVASDASASNDRLVSPFGPFVLDTNSIEDFGTEFSITAKLNSSDYGTQLDTEEQGVGTIKIVDEIPGSAVETIQDFELTYYLEDTHRFAIRVENVSGFVTGLNLIPARNIVRACKVTVGTGCDEDNETVQILGKARIDYIDANQNVLYLTALDFDHDSDGGATTGDFPSIFKKGNFIHNGTSTGGGGLSTFVSTQVSDASRIFRDTDSGITISPEYNIPNAVETTDDDPTNTIVYSVDNIPDSGFSFSPSTGVITITNPSAVYNTNVTITATDGTNGGVLDTYIINVNFVGAPSGLTYTGGSVTTKTFQAQIGGSTEETIFVTTDANSKVAEFTQTGDDIVNLNFIDYVPTATLPTGVSVASGDAVTNIVMTYAPTTFDNGATTYTIQGFFPAYDPTTPFASVTARFESATPFSQISYPQSTNDILILKVNDVSSFGTSTGSNNVSSQDGGAGTVLFIDDDNNQIYVQVSSNLTGESVFKAGDSLDNTASFVIPRTTITADADSVIHVFTTADANNRFVNPSGLAPGLFDDSGTSVTLAGGESLTYAITPTAPSDIPFNTTSGAFIATTDNSLSNLEPTVYTIQATDNIGNIVSASYAFTVAEAPSRVSVGRYQFVRIKGNNNRFYRGSRIQASDGTTGRVLMTVDLEGDGTNDGLLLENNGDLADGVGIDNTAVYFATESTVEPYHFIYVKDLGATSIFSVNETITTDDGTSSAVVKDFDLANDRVYIKVENGSFDPGDVVTDGTNSTIINSVEDRHYVTGVIEVDSLATLNGFDIGGAISSDNATSNGSGVVVMKHVDTGSTTGTTSDDRHYLLIQHISGNFAEGDNIDNAYTFSAGVGTISHIVGPTIDMVIPGGTTFTNGSISGRVDKNDHPFFEGSLIGAFNNTNSNYQSVGFSVYGTNYGSNKVRVAVEDFYSHFEAGGGSAYYLDDFTESNATVRAESHNHISSVTLSNLMIGYVGEALRLEPTVKGEFNSVSISPETLPAGLTFDSQTGRISGTPSEPLSGASYTMSFNSATNVLSPATYTFDLVVYNQFEVAHETANASSYVSHREGRGLAGSRCKVISPQVIDDIADPNYNQAIYGMNDIVCLFEGGESDIYNRGIDFDIKAGAGMCEYVRYVPFSYNNFLPGTTDRTITVYEPFDDAGNCNNGDNNEIVGSAVGTYVSAAPSTLAIPTAGRVWDSSVCESGNCVAGASANDVCNYDYRSLGAGYPNLDDGTVTVNTVSCNRNETDDGDTNGFPDDVTCTCNVSQTIKDCGGAAINGQTGAKVSSGVTTESVAAIYTTVAGTSSTGSEVKIDVESPESKNLASNYYVANFQASRLYAATATNSCIESKYHMDTYSSVGTLTTNRSLWEGYNLEVDPFGYSADGRYNNFYKFDCLDASFNVKARIRVFVREWDREFSTEDAEVESLVGFAQSSGAVTITKTAGNNTATLSAGISSDVFIGRGTVLYVEDGTTAGYQEDEDTTKFEVASYVPGATTMLLKSTSGAATGATFHVRSKLSDPSTTCFGDRCDSSYNFDSRYQVLDYDLINGGGTQNTNRPKIDSCADTNLATDLTVYNGATQGTFDMDTETVTLGGAGLGVNSLPRGAVIYVDFNNNGAIDSGEPHLQVVSGSGNTITLSGSPGFSGTHSILVVRRTPFPMEVPSN